MSEFRIRVPLAQLDDVQLASLAGRGDAAAFEALHARHRASLLAFCRQLLGSREDGEDALQQTFLRAYRALGKAPPPASVRAWLFAIARNRCRTMLAARRDATVPVALPNRGAGDPAEDAQRRADLRQLVADVAGLPDDQRAALVLSELGDLRHAEIAATIGCAPAKVKALVFQAREALIADRDARRIPCEQIRGVLETASANAGRRASIRRHLRQCAGCHDHVAAVSAAPRALPRRGRPAGRPSTVSAAVAHRPCGDAAPPVREEARLAVRHLSRLLPAPARSRRIGLQMTDPTVDADAFNAFEAAGWEQQVAGYEAFFVPITARLVGPLLDAAEVGRGARVLDVASGPGHVAAKAAQRGASVIGVDIAEGMLSLARQLHPELEFRHGNAEALPFPDGSFDAVVANLVMLHVGRPEQAAAEFERVLAPDGRLALTVWDVPERARFLGALVEAVATAEATPPQDLPVGPPIFRFSDDQEFANLLRAQRLEDIKVSTISFSHQEPSPDALWRGLLGGTVRISAIIRGQTSETQRRIREAFDRNMQQYEVDGGLELPVSVKLASGRKPA